MLRRWPIWVALALLLGACTDTTSETDYDGGVATTDTAFWDDSGKRCGDPTGDYDGDKIPNGDEGCLFGRDSDRDDIPDWQDFDSDNDKVSDKVEAGKKDDQSGACAEKGAKGTGWPCDTDGDKSPDYVDIDSDGDSLTDGNEDANNDGQVGCCITTCNKPDQSWQQANCTLNSEGCGREQKCVSGLCSPPVNFKCSEGETSAKAKDTFGDGKLDNERGTFICRDATEDKPQGRKAVQLRKSATTAGDWHIALEKSARYGLYTVDKPGTKMVAAAIDHDKSAEEVAGFVVSMSPSKDKLQDELAALVSSLQTELPKISGSSGSAVYVRASGTQGKSHDKYDSVTGTTLDITLSVAADVSTVRNHVVAALLGKKISDLSNLPAPYGGSYTSLVLRFTTVWRFEFKKDASGNVVDKYGKPVKQSGGDPVDSGDKSKWRLMVMGAVASKNNYSNPQRNTGFIMDDISGGTGLAVALDTVGNECDVGVISQLPVADIIWVVDESGSMDDKRNDVVNNANNFFSRALASGLDFRMGVTNVCSPTGSYKQIVGKFCSKISTSGTDDGGTDRFLLPSEQNIFSACIKNPPGYEGASEYGLVNSKDAVTSHLPRAASDPTKIRQNATLVVIMVTDEIPQSLYNIIGYSNLDKCTLDATTQASVDTAVQPYLNLFSGITDPEAVAMYHLIGGVCQSTGCAWEPDVAHGYKELAQKLNGQWADVCQKNLGNTLQVIIDTITGKASPIRLDYVPIASSVAVALDAVEVKRSRINGFDYRENANSLVFINVKYQKGSEVIASYKRWGRQSIVE